MHRRHKDREQAGVCIFTKQEFQDAGLITPYPSCLTPYILYFIPYPPASDIIILMIISLEEVEHIADLAHLELSAEEKERYREQLSAILDYAKSLQAIDTADIPPTSSVLPAHSNLRVDRATPGLSIENLMRNAPRADRDQFRVPPVLE